MKKYFFYAMMMVLAEFTMTSCETDQEIARRLTGVDWEGDLRTYATATSISTTMIVPGMTYA